jgi:hypothetical protein
MKVRVITDGNGRYRIQTRANWWPFWFLHRQNQYYSLAHALNAAQELLKSRSRKVWTEVERLN